MRKVFVFVALVLVVSVLTMGCGAKQAVEPVVHVTINAPIGHRVEQYGHTFDILPIDEDMIEEDAEEEVVENVNNTHPTSPEVRKTAAQKWLDARIALRESAEADYQSSAQDVKFAPMTESPDKVSFFEGVRERNNKLYAWGVGISPTIQLALNLADDDARSLLASAVSSERLLNTVVVRRIVKGKRAEALVSMPKP